MRCVLIFLALAAAAPPADSCSCADVSVAQHVKQAKRVVLGRAGKPEAKGAGHRQVFTVLETFKGAREATLVVELLARPPCLTEYKEGELAILFDTHADPCNGNLPLAAQVQDVPAIVKAVGFKRGAADAGALEASLRKALAGFLHDRPTVPIVFAPFAGKWFTVDKSRLVYGKKVTADAVRIDDAFTAGTVAFVKGRYKKEGVVFAVLALRGADGTWSVIEAQVAET